MKMIAVNRFIWGLDLSLKNTGLVIYDLNEKKFVYIGSYSTEKIYATKKNKGLYLNGVKLKHIAEWIYKIKEKYPPAKIIIERGFSRFNTETQVLFRCHGLINYIFWNVPQEYLTPKTIKATIYKGDATKAQVQRIIKNNFNEIEFENEDESDAFAVLISHLIKESLIEFEKPIVEKKKRKKKVEIEEEE